MVLLADKNLLQQRLALLNAHRNENNKQNFESPLYNHDEYATGYYEGANDTLVSLLDNLGIKHNEDIINKM